MSIGPFDVLVGPNGSGKSTFLDVIGILGDILRVGPTKSALGNLPEDEDRFPVAVWLKRLLLDGVQRIVLSSEAIRRPCPPGLPKALLPDGSNLPWIIHALPDEVRAQWVNHLQTALPDIQDITTIARSEDNHRYFQLVYANGLRAASWLVSGGTLRLMALTVLAYMPATPTLYLVEEPENGIHPSAMAAVCEALGNVGGGQVVCTTHSPAFVRLTGKHRLLCFSRDKQLGTAVMRGSLHPNLTGSNGDYDLVQTFASGAV